MGIERMVSFGTVIFVTASHLDRIAYGLIQAMSVVVKATKELMRLQVNSLLYFIRSRLEGLKPTMENFSVSYNLSLFLSTTLVHKGDLMERRRLKEEPLSSQLLKEHQHKIPAVDQIIPRQDLSPSFFYLKVFPRATTLELHSRFLPNSSNIHCVSIFAPSNIYTSTARSRSPRDSSVCTFTYPTRYSYAQDRQHGW